MVGSGARMGNNTKKLRSCMFGHKRIPSREGGIEVVVEELSTRMVKLGHQVTCYNRGGHHVSGKEFDGERLHEYKGVKLKTVPTINRKGLTAVSSSFFAALASAFGRYDVVHIHAEGPAAMCWIPKLFGKRVVVTIHGLDWQREKWKNGFGSKYIHLGEKMAVKFADEIIVLSKGVQEYFQKTYGRKTLFIPNGVNRPVLRKADLIKNKFGIDKDGYQVMAVDIIPEKVELINNRKSPIQDDYIEKYLAEKDLDLTATLDAKEAYTDADFVIIAAPTNVYSTNRIDVAQSKRTCFTHYMRH